MSAEGRPVSAKDRPMSPALPLRWGEAGLPAAPGRILLVQISAMGDQVQTLPAVSDIAARWPGIAIDWAVDARFADIPRLHPAVRHVFALPLKAMQQQRSFAVLGELRAVVRAIRAERYDLIWDPHSVLKSAIVSLLARGKLRVGYRAQDCGGEPLAAHAYHLHFTRPAGVHGTWGRRVFAQAVLDTDLLGPTRYRLSERIEIAAGSQTHILFAHGVSRPHREWAEDLWIELGRLLIGHGQRIKLTWGNERERERALRIMSALPEAAVTVSPPPPNLASLLRYIAESRLVVGVDTGFTHFAAALRRPQLGIFSAKTGPEVLLTEDRALVRSIGGNGHDPSVTEAWNAIAQLLELHSA